MSLGLDISQTEWLMGYAKRAYEQAVAAAKQREFLRSPEGLASLVVQRKY